MILSFINHKGGTGKTTSTVNVGAFLADLEYKVLIVDLDSQANSSQALNSDLDYSIYDAIENDFIEEDKIFKYNQFLSILSSNRTMINLEKKLTNTVVGREFIIKNLLKPIENKYDFILIDNPPALAVTTLNSIVCSDKIIIPLEAEYFSITGLKNIIDFFNLAKTSYNLNTQILGFFFTKFSENTNLSNHFIDELNQYYKAFLFQSKIRKNVKLGEAHLSGKTILDYDSSSNGAVDYNNLTNEILNLIKS
mgnify:CR=1 FL=1